MRPLSAVFPLVLVFLSCGGEPAAPAISTTEALLGGASMADTPWPSDALLKGDHLEISAIPLGGQPEPLAALAAALSELDGAPTFGSVFFPTSGGLENGPVEGAARWIDLDAKDTDGSAQPFTTPLFYRASTRDLVALAPTDAVLTPGHRYAVVVASPHVRASAAMRDATAGVGPLAGVYSPAASQITPGDAATVFTVGHPSKMVDAMRDVAAALPPPKAAVARVVRGADLDDLFGTPKTTRPGLGDPAGIVHDAIDTVILGSFEAPSFLSETPPKLGRVELDAAGAPRVKATQTITFMLTLPKKASGGFANTPVIIFQHGLNAGRTQVATPANDYAREGFATIGIDALWHGDRAESPEDKIHNYSGKSGADGLADGSAIGASLSLFDFNGDPAQGIGPFDGRVVRDNLRQAIVDLTELVRFLKLGDVSAISAADPALAGFSFDATSLVYTGESFGSVIGAGALAAAPDLPAAVLSVGGGGVFLPILPNSPLFAGLIPPFLRTSFDPSLDVEDPIALPGAAQRSLSLLEAAILPGDPLAFAPLYAERKKHVLLLMAQEDELIPNRATELLAAAAGAVAVSLPSGSAPLRFVDLPSVDAPYAAPSGESTRAIVQLAPALHTMFTSFTDQRRYQPSFPPFLPLDEPEQVSNPIEMAHALAVGFAESFRQSGTPRVELKAP